MAESEAPPVRGMKFRGPEGEVEVSAVDFAVEGAITARPVNGGQEIKVPLEEWKSSYVFVHPDGSMDEVADAARRGFDSAPPVTQVRTPAQVVKPEEQDTEDLTSSPPEEKPVKTSRNRSKR